MQTDWATFKSIVDARSLSIQYVDISTAYWMKLFDGGFALECVVTKDGGSDQTDFETNYKTNGNQSIKQAVIQQLGADTLSLSPFGALINPAANTLSNCDVQIPMTVVLRGGVVFSQNSAMGDWFSVSVIDKNNIVGAGGTPDNPTILATYIASWYLMPGVVNSVEDVSISMPLPQGLYMRIAYTSVGNVAPSVVINFITYIGTP